MINDNQHIINRKVVMIQKGHTLGTLAEHVGHTKQAVSQSIQGRSTSLRIHRKIADVMGVKLVDFWPELYGEVTKADPHPPPAHQINADREHARNGGKNGLEEIEKRRKRTL